MSVSGFTPADWDAVPSYMFGDQDKPREQCYCVGCTSEGAIPQGRDCLHWQECNPERGHHGDACECIAPDGEEW